MNQTHEMRILICPKGKRIANANTALHLRPQAASASPALMPISAFSLVIRYAIFGLLTSPAG